MFATRLPRIVPWSNFDEWLETYQLLFSDPSMPDKRAEGVRRVKAWSSRGKVPHAVESTAGLVEVWLRDGCGGAFIPSISELEIRLMYTMVFIRFVNGITDVAQKGSYASSVSYLAGSMGLPSWFVELRHSGTHDQLPGLTILRSGCLQALTWLEENYWKLQKTEETNTAVQIQDMLVQYKLNRKAQIKSGRGVDSLDSTASALLVDISTVLISDSFQSILIPALMETGTLVPTAVRKRCPSDDCVLPTELVQLWHPLLERYDHHWADFTQSLLRAIIESCGKSGIATAPQVAPAPSVDEESGTPNTDDSASLSYARTLAGWGCHIVQSFIAPKAVDDDQIQDLVEACARNSSVHNKMILQELAKAAPAIQERVLPILKYMSVQDTLSELAETSDQDMSTNDSMDDELDSQEGIHHLSELQNVLPDAGSAPETAANSSLEENTEAPGPSVSSWTRMPKTWRPSPIGTLSGGTFPSLDLPAEFDDVAFLQEQGILCIPLDEDAKEAAASEANENHEHHGNQGVVPLASNSAAQVHPHNSEQSLLAISSNISLF
ncbi:Las1-like-domain-containing protein [Polychytrium aggregatum]|uniref:Las1-like-domain-containing protein n=1 Tax=Polychytrium aggregatum TaxID=110093 RepID=UPI0022FE8C14|nr:Las1-like-domain-containing protein [Polychytrium aggregatum]KAI9199413.1 Las1-like-domain-containing protein [Polychytrium aggregatum]